MCIDIIFAKSLKNGQNIYKPFVHDFGHSYSLTKGFSNTLIARFYHAKDVQKNSWGAGGEGVIQPANATFGR